MKKIPTLFVRDFEGSKGRYVTDELVPGLEWVLAGEGVATRKYDGTCVLIRRDGMAVKAFARREVKAGKEPPPGFVLIETDDTTGKTVGWEPAEQSGFAKYIAEAITGDEMPGTYELVGPKVQGNPEGYDTHTLLAHADAETMEQEPNVAADAPGGVLNLIAVAREYGWEGIVWHHPDGRMAKLKVRDFPSGPSVTGTE